MTYTYTFSIPCTYTATPFMTNDESKPESTVIEILVEAQDLTEAKRRLMKKLSYRPMNDRKS